MELVCIGIFKWFLPIKGLKLHIKAMPQFTVQSAKGKATFLQNNLFKLKNGTQKLQKQIITLYLVQTMFFRGGKSSSQTSTLQTLSKSWEGKNGLYIAQVTPTI